jgi:hypothetical protein
VTSPWLGLRLVGRRGAREPIGARAVLTVDGRPQLRLVKSGASYLSTPDPRLLFHYPATAQEVSLRIEWPGGHVQHLHALEPGQYHTIIEPE